MTDLDIEMAIIGTLRDARILSTAPRHKLRPHLELLREAQDELTLAVHRLEEREAA